MKSSSLLKNAALLFALPFTVCAATPAVTAARAENSRINSARSYAGIIEAFEKVDIMPRVTGELQKIHFTEGGAVKKGDLLFELEDTTYRAAVEALEARKEQLISQVDFMGKEFKRYQELITNKAVAVSTYDRALFELNSAKAQLKEVEASLVNARNNLSYTRIYAPISGVIGKSTFTVGNLITPGGKKLADIEMISPVSVRFSISETILLREFGGRNNIMNNALVTIRLADGKTYPIQAALYMADNQINPSTNTITLRAKFDNPDSLLVPGGYVTVSLSNRNNPPAVTVLPSAVIIDDNKTGVFVIDEQNKAFFRQVTAGKISGDRQIITSGVKAGELVVVEGMHKLTDGMTVRPVIE